MQFLLTHILDFLFPPPKEEMQLRKVAREDIVRHLPRAAGTPFTFITPLFAYQDKLVNELIWSIKNKKNTHAIRCGAFALYSQLKDMPYEKILLIPIPISNKRRRERGYNQCELLVDEVAKLDDAGKFIKDFSILKRTQHSADQKLKSREERLSSNNPFTVEKSNTTQIPVVLIDDVATTGSTLEQARAALLKAGYINITAVTLAH